MVILEMSGLPARGLVLVWFAPFGAVESPVAKEYHKAVKQPKERGKIDSLLDSLCRFGFATHGIRFEKVKGAKMGIYELKITAQGSEHRFLAGYAQARSREGLPVLVLLRYVKKKRWKLDRTDIDTAVSRLAVAG